MNLAVAILAIFLGSFVAESMQAMNPEKMQKIESEKNENRK
jgi:cytochrome bd-type quinol oxidase subunit 1